MSSLQIFFLVFTILAVLLFFVPVVSRVRAARNAPAHDPIESVSEPVDPTRPRSVLRLGSSGFGAYLSTMLSRSGITNETWGDLEEALIRSDAGVGVAAELIEATKMRVKSDSIKDPEAMLGVLKQEIEASISGLDRSLTQSGVTTSIWLFVGVNGVGKTTTIGKVAHRMSSSGSSVLLAAGDTFRAAAAEQLETWASRTGSEIVRGAHGADPSSVMFDAVSSAEAKGIDLVLGDTAGRLHNKSNLMNELTKVKRVAEKGSAKVEEVLLVIDATTGQNGLAQATKFAEAVDVTGVVLTKLDGSAKGGIVLAIQSQLGIPVKLVGVGEQLEDLIDFDPHEFVEALFAR